MRSAASALSGLLAVALVIAGCTAASPSPSASTGGSVAPSASAEPSPTPEGTPATDPYVELTWTAEHFAGEVHALTQTGGQLVAVGRDDEGLASWTSTDGVTWERHDVPDPTFIEAMLDDFGPALYDGTRMGPLTLLGDTLFSFGTWLGPIDFYRPVAWRSTDNVRWEFIESDSEFYSYGAVTDAATFGETIYAARATGLTGAAYSLWTWTATESWRETSVRSSDREMIQALDLAAFEGGVLAVGSVARPRNGPESEWPTEPRIWQSTFGEPWTEITPPDDMERAYRVAFDTGGGFSVIGRGVVGTMSIWHTVDGSEWTSTDLDVCENVGDCDVEAMATIGDRLVAIHSHAGQGTIWLSIDGMNWLQQATPELRPPGVALADELSVAGLDGQLFAFVNARTEDLAARLFRGDEPSP